MTTNTNRLMLDHLNFSVTDLAATMDWYGRVFGFEVVERGVYQGAPWAILRGGDAMLAVYEHPDRHQATAQEIAKSKTHALSHFSLRVQDRTAWEATIQSENVTVRYDGPNRWPASTSWYVEDPSGYEIEVVYWDHNVVSFEHAVSTVTAG